MSASSHFSFYESAKGRGRPIPMFTYPSFSTSKEGDIHLEAKSLTALSVTERSRVPAHRKSATWHIAPFFQVVVTKSFPR